MGRAIRGAYGAMKDREINKKVKDDNMRLLFAVGIGTVLFIYAVIGVLSL